MYITHVCAKSCPTLLQPPWTVVCQAPLSMEFFRREYFSGLPFPLPGDLPNPRIKPMSPASPASAGGFSITMPPGKPNIIHKENLFKLSISMLFISYNHD